MRAVTLLITSLFLMTTLSGCFGGDEPLQKEPEDERLPEGVFITGPDGNSTEGIPLELNFTFSDTGVDGPEPSIGITSSGCMFFVAMAKVMRSCDGGESWEDVANYASAPTTSDPYLWVDPVTDRIF
ncbi:MAG: hypothetical protein HOB52_04945, partial [Euryarchaeota archaeon]|nr:hypothetical protein [Euryarchaeota archaeon]